jgi:hypothetical protein
MANIKISQLPSATAVSANVDVLPIVHTGVTQKVTPDLLVNEVLKAPDYIGSDTPNDADFVDVVISGSLTASPASKNITLSPTGSGRINMLPGGGMTVAPVGLGTMDNVVIGSTTAQSGAFTSLTSSSATTLNGTTIPASKTLLVTTDIGSSVQAYDLDLAAIAGLTGTSGFLKKTGVNSWALDTIISSGTVTDVALTAPTGLTVSGSPITTSGTLAITYTSGYSLPTNASQANWDTAYADRLKWDGGATGLVAATGRTSLELGTLATQNANSVSITGGAISGASGSFTTLSASSTVSGTGFSNYLASPPAIGGATASTGRFTTITSTVATGTAPFTVASTTNVANLNASSLNGATFAAPGAIGSGTAAAGTFTNLSYTGTLTGGTGVIAIGTNQIYKDASGNVGIGTSSPGTRLDVLCATNGGFRITDGTHTCLLTPSGVGGIALYATSNHPLVFGTNNTERARITAAGNLLVNDTVERGGKVVVTNTPTSQWGIDHSGSQITLTNGANAVLATGSGLIVLNSHTTGEAGVYLLCGSSIFKLGGNASYVVSSTPSAGQVGVGWTGSSYAIYNNVGSTQTFGIAMIRTRAAV